MKTLCYILTAAAAYFTGCLNPAYFISKRKGIDMRSGGSGNLGTCNSVLMLGMRWGSIVFLYDAGKAILAVLLAGHLFSGLPYIGAAAGIGCVLGHIFPFYLRFRGGKGFASFLGMTLALDWRLGLAVLAATAVITVLTDHIVYATASTVVFVPLYFLTVKDEPVTALLLCIPTAVILWKHRENFIRLRKGTEISLRDALKDKRGKAA